MIEREMLAGLSDEEITALVSSLPPTAIEALLRSTVNASIPVGPAEQGQELDPGYVIRDHTAYISQRLAHAVSEAGQGRSQRLVIETPPRVGKSTLVSVYLPLWVMRHHPEWKIALISYDPTLTTSWARHIRSEIEENEHLGIRLINDGGAVGNYTTSAGGEVRARSTGKALTGTGANLLIIDDPVKDFADAHSPVRRQALWDWWLSVAQTRLEHPSIVVTTMCMTGDTPVLRPDGSETPLRDIRPRDEIATFTDAGEVTTSVVSNWMSQGLDDTFAVHLASGRVVRANARHPFWVIDEDGSGSWVRLGSLRAGMKVRCLAAPTEGSSAPPTAATSPRSARACACPTTPERGMRQAIDLPPLLTRADVGFGSKDATASPPRTTTDSSLSRMNDAQSVEGTSPKSSSLLIGQKSSASTTATTLESCEACSATIATSSLLAATRPTSFGGPLSTSVVSTDEITSITPAGREEVFDIEVVGTHRFIANGLDVSNTRWHEDDLVGRMLSREWEGNPDDWEEIRLPALAESDDPIGREVGEPLLSPIISESKDEALVRWGETRSAVGSYTFSSMFQQRPAPAKGAIFDSEWWRFWTTDPSRVTSDGRVVLLDPEVDLAGARWIESWDAAFKGTEASDYVVGQRWARSGANRYLITQRRGRWAFTQTIEAMRSMTTSGPGARLTHQRLVEEKANGAAIIDTLKEEIAGIKAINPMVGKEGRARAVTPEVESGHVYLPHPSDGGHEWVSDLLSELRNFPHDAHDDQVDALTQALAELRDVGRGSVTVPRQAASQRSIIGTAHSYARRQRGPGGR